MTFVGSAYIKIQGESWRHVALCLEADDVCLAVYGFWLKVGREHQGLAVPLRVSHFHLQPLNPELEPHAQA
ncbi:MAG: hypothetical protein V3S82_10325 [Dehalococcoidia bacterium]